MCGFAGCFSPGCKIAPEHGARLARAMAAPIVHRGPDDEGVFVAPEAGFAAGFRRLAIIDLSAAGHQPMTSQAKRLTILFNGEIYNRDELAADVEARGMRLRGHSDTEAMLEHMALFGIEATLGRLIGMFAIALLDEESRALTLIRDRMGIKPLFWGRCGSGRDETFLFASQPKCFLAHPAFQPALDGAAMADYLRLGYVPAPGSIYQGVRKLEPGHMLTVDAAGRVTERCWWDIGAVARAGVEHPAGLDDGAAIEAFDALLTDSVRRRMVADVPLGAFLSGGIDSSLTVARMQRSSARPIRTFTIGFTDQHYDESDHAEAVARHLGTEHTSLRLEPEDAVALVPQLPEWLDEPLADASMLPTLLVSRLARKDVTVALSGDGGDELFAGYTRYDDVLRLERRAARLPRGLRKTLAKLLGALPASALCSLDAHLPGKALRLDERIARLAALLEGDPETLMRDIVSHWRAPSSLAPGLVEQSGSAWQASSGLGIPESLQLADMRGYLPEDILAKVDRASMACGLEARVPLLDHRLVGLAWSLRSNQRRRGNETKWLLRRLLDRDYPAGFFDRPKKGFSLPMDAWLRGPLRDWAESLLAPASLQRLPCLDRRRVETIWQQHLGQRADRRFEIYNLLMLLAWHERWMSPAAANERQRAMATG